MIERKMGRPNEKSLERDSTGDFFQASDGDRNDGPLLRRKRQVTCRRMEGKEEEKGIRGRIVIHVGFMRGRPRGRHAKERDSENHSDHKTGKRRHNGSFQLKGRFSKKQFSIRSII